MGGHHYPQLASEATEMLRGHVTSSGHTSSRGRRGVADVTLPTTVCGSPCTPGLCEVCQRNLLLDVVSTGRFSVRDPGLELGFSKCGLEGGEGLRGYRDLSCLGCEK